MKQLSQSSHQGTSQFVTEVATISAVQHRNLVILHGCCIDSKTPLLVYEYLENGSLDRAIFGEFTSAKLPPSALIELYFLSSQIKLTLQQIYLVETFS